MRSGKHVGWARTLILATMVAAWLAPRPAATAEAPNPIQNASFEQPEAPKPAQWQTQTWGGTATFLYESPGHDGDRCVAITSDQGADVAWQTTVPVEPFATYRLSGWIKTENVAQHGRGALFNLHNLQPVATTAVTGTNDWTRVEVVFETEEQESVQVNCLFGGWGLATGKAWYDDLRLELLSAQPLKAEHHDRRRPRPASRSRSTSTASSSSTWAAASTAASGPKCSKTASSSTPSAPSSRRGSRSAPPAPVTMDPRASHLSAQHTPQDRPARRASPPASSRAGLGLREGKQYVGRIWLAGDAGGRAGRRQPRLGRRAGPAADGHDRHA